LGDLRTLEKRLTHLEQAAEAERAATTGIASDDLRHDELVAWLYGVLPAQDGERVGALLAGELHVISSRHPDLEHLSLDKLNAIAQDLRRRCEESWFGEELFDRDGGKDWCLEGCEDPATCGCTRAVGRQRLLATGAYVEAEEL
jgi:hypothetical protein